MNVPFYSPGKVRAVCSQAVVGGLLFTASAQASAVNWGNVQDISGPGTTTVTTTKTDGGPGNNQTINNGTNDVNEQGTMVLGVNFDGQPGVSFPYTTTIDGQNFYSLSDLPGSSGKPAIFGRTFNRGTLTNQYNGYTPEPSGRAYGVFDQGANGQLSGPSTDYTLANAIFGNSTTASFSVGNLTRVTSISRRDLGFSIPETPSTPTRVETVSSSTGGDTNVPTLEYGVDRYGWTMGHRHFCGGWHGNRNV